MKNKIKYLRQQRNLTQKQMAEKLGIARPTLSNIERGVQIPAGSMIFKIASFFGQPAEQVFYEDTVPLEEK